MGLPTGYADLRREVLRRVRRPRAGARRTRRPWTPSSTGSRRASRPHNLSSWHPRSLSYFTPPPLVASIAGEVLAQWLNQGVDVWHAGPVAAFVEEEVGRWLCDLVGYGEGSFGLCTSGGVMANFIALALVRDVHLRALREADRPAARRGARGRPRVRERPDPLLDRPRARRAGLPARDARRAAGRRPLPPPRRARRRGDRRGPGARPDARSRSAPSRARPTRARWTSCRSSRRLARAEGLWLHVDAAYGGAARLSGARRRAGSRASSSPTRSPSTPTSGSSRPTTSARCSSAGATTCARRSTARPSTTAAARRTDGRCHATGRGPRRPRAAQLNFYKLGFEGTRRFRVAQALGLVAPPRDDGPGPARRAQRRRRRLPRRALPGGRRPRGHPRGARALRRVLPAPARRRRRGGRDGPARPRRPPGPPRGRARGLGRRLALDDDPAWPDVPPRRAS